MLDEFLQVAYQTNGRKQAEFELVGMMEGLPVVELRKLAEGTPIAALYGHLDKTAYLDSPCADGAPKTFLDRFQGSPLFDQAVALEQQELQAEMTDMQKRQERRQQNVADDTLYDVKDRIRVQKRLLELELAKQELGGAAAAGGAGAPPAPGMTPAQGAGAPGEVPPEGPEAGASAVVGKTAQAKFLFADNLGREMARVDFAKHAQAVKLAKVGEAAGAAMAKIALGLGDIGGAMKGLAAGGGALGKAVGFAAKNPGLVGAGVGAAGGALAGGPGHRLEGAAGGAALGGMAGGVGGRMAAGQGLGAAAQNTARAGINTAMRGVNTVAGKLPGQLSSTVSGAAQNMNQAGHDLISRAAGVGV